MKLKWLIPLVLIVVLLITSIPAVAAAPENGNRPVNAADVQIVKKVTLKGPAARGGKPSSYAAAGIVGDPLPNSGKKYAMVIGINNYPGTSNDLQYCVNDAEEMASVLGNIYHFDSIDTILNTAATYENIEGKIQALASTAGPDDEVVFFFSGHGAKGKADDGDSNKIDQSIVVWDNSSWGYIWDGEMKSWFNDFDVNRLVFIFDSCLSGGMSVLQGPGRVVNMACSANGVSYEGTQWGGGHGQFTYYFAEEGMDDGLADVRSQDGVVTDEEAFDYAEANCKYQSPVVTDGFTNDLEP